MHTITGRWGYGLFLALLTALLWGILPIKLKQVLQVVDPVTVTWYRLLVSGGLLFAWLAGHGRDLSALIVVVSADNLAGGIASAAFIGYLSSLTNVNYSATQYALFSSMMLLAPKFIAGFSGEFVDHFGYAAFFNTTAALGLPVVLLVALALRSTGRPRPLPESQR